MPVYPYKCPDCSRQFDVAKRVNHIDEVEFCPSCQSECHAKDRLICRSTFHGAGVEDPVYDHSLGMVVKSSAHRRQIAKEKGLIEIGNEPVDKVIAHFDKQREQRTLDNYKKLYEPYEVKSR